jgi:hypothetical protein
VRTPSVMLVPKFGMNTLSFVSRSPAMSNTRMFEPAAGTPVSITYIFFSSGASAMPFGRPKFPAATVARPLRGSSR